MATISFPYPPQGLHAFRKLREYRKLHELSYPLEDIRNEKNPGILVGKKKRGKILVNQKANSIADIAATLMKQEEDGHDWESAAESKPSKKEKMRKGRQQRISSQSDSREKSIDASAPGKVRSTSSEAPNVTIAWRNLLDAGFAERWPAAVVHGGLDYTRHTTGPPLPSS